MFYFFPLIQALIQTTETHMELHQPLTLHSEMTASEEANG